MLIPVGRGASGFPLELGRKKKGREERDPFFMLMGESSAEMYNRLVRPQLEKRERKSPEGKSTRHTRSDTPPKEGREEGLAQRGERSGSRPAEKG